MDNISTSALIGYVEMSRYKWLSSDYLKNKPENKKFLRISSSYFKTLKWEESERWGIEVGGVRKVKY